MTGGNMETFELFQRMSAALAIGLLIGLERGWKEREDQEGTRSAGFRTHALAGLLGATWGAIATRPGLDGGSMLALAFAAFSAAIILFRYRESGHEGTFGVTSVVAAMLAFALGALAMIGNLQLAIAAGVATAALLALKRAMHDWVRRLTWVELRSGLVLATMTFIMLPVLPNRDVPEIAGLNPYEIWLMTVLIAGISFAGYVAVKVAGNERGVVLTGIAAGLVSSTAVTMTLAERAKERPELTRLFTAGALLAGTTMMLRVLVVVALLNAALARPLAPPLIAAAAVTAAIALLMMWRQSRQNGDVAPIELSNPIELATVLKFGALLALIMLATKLASGVAGGQGLLGLALLSGLADVDAMTLAMTRQAGAGIDMRLAVQVIALVVAVNTLAKAALAWSAGGSGPGLPMLLTGAVAIAAGAAAFAIDSTIGG